MTQEWVVYGGMRHAEPQREMFSRSYETPALLTQILTQVHLRSISGS